MPIKVSFFDTPYDPAPVSRLTGGGAETGSTADRDWFAECPSGIGRDAGAESTASEGVQYTMLGELDFFDCGFAASHAATNDAGINRRCYNENPILRSCSPQE
jgi:hypothetical protein